MKMQRTLTVIGLSAVLAISAVSVSFAQQGTATLNQRGGGGGRPGGALVRAAGGVFLGIQFEVVEGGVKVVEVEAGSPAETAGLMVDDVITAIAGKDIGSGDIRKALRDYKVGDALDLTVTRGDETLTISVTLGENTGVLREAMQIRGQARLGAVLEEDTLTVAEILEDSPAAAAGLEVGDTITAIDGTAVTTRAEVVAALTEAQRSAADDEDATVTLTVTRGDASVDLTATLPAPPTRPEMFAMPGMGRGMRGLFIQPREDGSGFDVVLPFTLPEGKELTADAQAAIADLGWTVQPKEGEDGVYELIIPAESVRDGLNLTPLEGLEGMEGMMFAFGMPDALHFSAPAQGAVIPAAPAVAGSNL